MSYDYLFKYIIIGDTGWSLFLLYLPFLCFFSLFNFNWDLDYRRREVMPALAIH
jgi:hypothetical protein